MASIKKHGTGWRAFIDRKGVRKTKVWPTKAAAEDWARLVEYDIIHGATPGERKTLAEAFTKYADEVSEKKRGGREEKIRLKRFSAYTIAKKIIGEITPSDVAKWREKRLEEVSGASVRREMQLIAGVFSVARKEWGWIKASPMIDVRRPKASPRRNRIASKDEMKALALSGGSDPSKATRRAWLAFEFACETAMRAGELRGLTAETVDVQRRVAHLPETKNGEARDVPLSSRAIEIWESLPNGFDLTAAQLDALWRKLRERAGLENLRFHDSRHAGVTRLAKVFDVLDLARVVGHRDVKMLMVYYEADAEELAKKLD